MEDIIQGAVEFHDKIEPYLDPAQESEIDVDILRYYLRKIEGAEILLTHETNFFRQALHKRVPIAPEAPPLIEESKSTRKPRPTKLQKMMAQFQVDDPGDLPERVRLRANSTRRRTLNAPDSTSSFRPSGSMGGGSSSQHVADGNGRGRTLSNASAGERRSDLYSGGAQGVGRSAEISRLLSTYDDGVLKERLLRGDFGAADVKALSEKEMESVLDILSRNVEGPRRARELFGQGVADRVEERRPRAENSSVVGDADKGHPGGAMDVDMKGMGSESRTRDGEAAGN